MANTAHQIDYTDTQLDEALDRAMTVPAVSSSDNNKVMMVQNGVWAARSITMQVYYTGSPAPSSSLGSDGDIYIQTT